VGGEGTLGIATRIAVRLTPNPPAVRTLLLSFGSVRDAAATFRIGVAEVDLGAFEVRRDGAVQPLSPKEAGMLALLHREQGLAVRRDRILDEVWGSEDFVGPRAVDTHVVNLRQKIEVDPRHPRHLLTVHGVGYRLVLEPGP
jgi:DNA-binding response OmpR family regulator